MEISKGVIYFILAWLLANLFGLSLWPVRFFQAVFVLYFSNFLVFPLLFLIFYGGVWRKSQNAWVLHKIFLPAALTALSIFAYATLIEPARLQMESIPFKTAKLAQPLRILHISDLQPGYIGAYEERAFALMREQKPDLVLFTGDMIQPYSFADSGQELQKMAALFKTLQPRYGVYAALGDTDHRLDPAIFGPQAGIYFLQDQAATLAVESGGVRLLGLTLASSRRGALPLMQDWASQPEAASAFNIVLGHAPDFVLDFKDLPQEASVDLALAGHTHGGQIRLPFWGPFVTLSQVPKDWALGWHMAGKVPFHVSAGVGAEHYANLPSIRFLCPPAITMIVITKAKEE